jgi:hypothetical protein
MTGRPLPAKKEGDFVACTDPAIREYILHRNAALPEMQRFILKDLPPVHLFVKKGSGPQIIAFVNQLIDNNTFLEENR